MAEKPKRKIFQPNFLSDLLLNTHLSHGGNLNDTINEAILNYFSPKIPALKKAFEFLCFLMQKNEKPNDDELKGLLSSILKALSNYPIKDCSILEKIFYYFNMYGSQYGNSKTSYEYILLVDDLADQKLKHLNEILHTLDKNNNLWSRELGPRSRTIFENWETLYTYSEIYDALSLIIDYEKIHTLIDLDDLLYYVYLLDILASQSNILPCKEPFPVNVSLKDKYFGIKNEIIIYYTDNAYFYLSKDYNFENMPKEIKEYYRDIEKEAYRRTSDRFFEPTEEDMQYITSLERKGRRLFRKLAAKDNILE